MVNKFLKLLFWCAVPFLIYFSIENAVILAVEICCPRLWHKPDFPLAVTGAMDLLTIPILMGLYRADGRFQRRPPDRSGETGWRVCLLSALSFVGIYFAVNLLLDVFGIAWSDEEFQEVSESIDSASVGLQILVAGIIGPWMEELLFRGLLLRRTERAAGPLGAMLLSAAMFGVFHGNLTQGLAAFFLGVFLGTAYLCTDSLLIPVLMHAAANCTAVLLGLPAAAELLDSDLVYLAVPCLSALALGVFLRIYAGPFRRLLRNRHLNREEMEKLQAAAVPWPEMPSDAPEEEGPAEAAPEAPAEAAPEAPAEAPESNTNGISGEFRKPDENKGDIT